MFKRLSSVTLPGWLQTSGWASPWFSLAAISPDDLAHWVAGSQLIQGPKALLDKPLSKIRETMSQFAWVHGVLRLAHVLSFVLMVGAAMVAPTGLIGATVVLSAAIALARLVISPVPLRWTFIDTLVALFFLTALVSTAFSSYVHTSLIGLGKFSIYALSFITARVLLGSQPKWLTGLMGVLLCAGFAEALVGFYQYVNHIQPLATWQDTSLNPEDTMTRVFGTLKPSNPNLLAGFLIPGIACGITLTLEQLFRRHWILATALAASTLLTLGGLVLSGSRGGFLAIGLMAGGTFAYVGHLLWHQPELKTQYRLKALWLLSLIGGLLAVAAGVAVVPALRTRVLSIFAMREDSSNSYRMNVWLSTIQMIKDNWLWGIGPGNDTFKQVYGLYMIPGYNALSAYSIFLEIWAEQGILGILSFLLLLGVSKTRAFLVAYSDLPLGVQIRTFGLLIGVFASVIYGLFDTIWYRPSVNILFWFLIAAYIVTSEQVFGPKNTTQEA